MDHGKYPRQVQAGTPDYPLLVYVFSEGHRGWLENSIETPYMRSGACPQCSKSQCLKSHPKCDGLTYDKRNQT